jgi:hypothetical protein
MAERVPQSQDNSAADNAAEDLNILFPDQSLLIANEQITVTEYPFMTWIELKPLCKPLIEEFTEFMRRGDDVAADELLECFENHFQILQTLLCKSIDKPVEFLEKLSYSDMQILLLTWWSVNKNFFLQSANRLLRAATKTQSDGQTSSSS